MRPTNRASAVGTLGGILFAVGAIVFLDIFISFSGPSAFSILGPGTLGPEDIPMWKSFGGIGLMVLGALLIRAGLGVELTGPTGLLARWIDAASQASAVALNRSPGIGTVVKVRCLKCRALNDEEASSCASCGSDL